MAYDTIHNITAKTQLHEVIQPGGSAIEQKKTTYDWKLLERVQRLYTDRGQKIEKHHSDPQFLGGKKNQELTDIPEKVHDQLHTDLNKHLGQVKDAAGHDMAPRRGNSGQQIRSNFSAGERQEAVGDFYKDNAIRYYEAAKDFFKQHPELK